MLETIQGIGLDVLATVAAALFATTFLDDAIASGLSRIPVVGAVLAGLARRLSARFRTWALERVPATAEKKVREVESKIDAPGTGAVKASVAAAELVKAEPGLTQSEAEREIEAAFHRVIGSRRLEAQAEKRAAASVAK